MTASQYKRIRTRIERAAKLTTEAHELLLQAQPYVQFRDHTLATITARAADNMTDAVSALDAREARQRQDAESLIRQLREQQP